MSLFQICLLDLALFKQLGFEGVLISNAIISTFLFDLLNFYFLLCIHLEHHILNLIFCFLFAFSLKFPVDLLPLLVQLVSEVIFFSCTLSSQISLEFQVGSLVVGIHLLSQFGQLVLALRQKFLLDSCFVSLTLACKIV